MHGLLDSLNDAPPAYIRVNTCLTTAEELTAVLTDAGVTCTPIDGLPNALCVSPAQALHHLPDEITSHFYYQDAASQWCCFALGAQPNERVADANAAVQSRPLEDGLLDAAGIALGVVVCDDADEGLIPAEHLHRCAWLFLEGRHDLVRCRGVRVRVNREDNGIRNFAGSNAERHPGTDAERSRLIRRGRHNCALGGVAPSADDHGLACQLWTAKDLNGCDELIEVDVQHPRRVC